MSRTVLIVWHGDGCERLWREHREGKIDQRAFLWNLLLLQRHRPGEGQQPFNPRELVARIRAILRRTKPASVADVAPEVLSVGDVELDPATRSVLRAGQAVDLTSVEFNLLEVLLREAGRVVTRERLVNAVLGRKFMPFDRSIDMHVSKVRRKLGDSEENGDHIKTIRGVGYMFARPSKAKK